MSQRILCQIERYDYLTQQQTKEVVHTLQKGNEWIYFDQEKAKHQLKADHRQFQLDRFGQVHSCILLGETTSCTVISEYGTMVLDIQCQSYIYRENEIQIEYTLYENSDIIQHQKVTWTFQKEVYS